MCLGYQKKTAPHFRPHQVSQQKAVSAAPHLILRRVKGRECNHETFSTIVYDSNLRTWNTPDEKWKKLAIAKTHRNQFSNMITVGRAVNNDLILPFPYISKFHAYIQSAGESCYLLTDASSANGTFVNGEKLPPNVPVELKNGSTVSFAHGLEYLFQTGGA